MIPLDAACVSDLGPGDRLHVECVCKRVVIIPPRFLLQKLRLRPDDRIADFAPRLRCRGCDERGNVVVGVIWAGR